MRAPDRGRYAVEPPGAAGSFPEDRIVLERDVTSGREEFILDPPISYLASVPGCDGTVEIIVPPAGQLLPHRPDLRAVVVHLAGA